MRLPSALLAKLASDLRASYWFIPATLVCAAFVLALVVAWIDRNPDVLPVTLPDAMLDTQIDGARAVLTVIATSVIGVAGVMFSVTIVAVSFASGKYGPRLIGNFMRDRGNQWSLGILISTFVYALIMLREIQGEADSISVFVPQYGLWLAIALALLAVATMIYFVHHIPETINVSHITADLGKRLCAAVEEPDLQPPAFTRDRDPDDSGQSHVTATAPGYLQTVDVAGIAACAEQTGMSVTLLVAPGNFVTAGDAVFRVGAADLDSATAKELSGTLAFGQGPTEEQNTTFIAQQLVEMIARALSPGVNDPFTAINCLNWLYAGLVRKAQHGAARNTHDLVTLPDAGFADLLNTAFGNSLPYVKDDNLVTEHLHSLLERLHGHAKGSDRAAITRLMNKL